MGATVSPAIDMSTLILKAYELSDYIKASVEVAEYLHWKQALSEDEEAKAIIRRFQTAKEKFAECERFGHFHPDYHQALEEARQWEARLHEIETVRRFREAEDALDDLLYEISKTIAHAVSESIKVPSNKLLPESGCCASGGKCSGRCG